MSPGLLLEYNVNLLSINNLPLNLETDQNELLL